MEVSVWVAVIMLVLKQVFRAIAGEKGAGICWLQWRERVGEFCSPMVCQLPLIPACVCSFQPVQPSGQSIRRLLPLLSAVRLGALGNDNVAKFVTLPKPPLTCTAE